MRGRIAVEQVTASLTARWRTDSLKHELTKAKERLAT